MPLNTSTVVYALSWVAVVFAIVATVCWISIVADGNYCWSAFAFAMSATPVNLGVLLLGVIPSSILYFRTRQRSDLTTLLLAGCSFVIVLVETVSLWIIPMRGE
jgi:hypothetical protein